jgi:hypothetical protein
MTQENRPLKVLAFTATAKRPFYIRHCMFQMQQQGYPIDHVIYMNSNEYNNEKDEHNYMDLIADVSIAAGSGNKVFAGYGPSASHHLNHMAAVNLVDWREYDLFFKIDDDDIYKRNYVEDTVSHHLEHGWDFSGEISKGHIYLEKWKKNYSLRQYKADNNHENAQFMPPTFVWTKPCMEIIMGFDDIKGHEDPVWKETLVTNKNLKTMVRPEGNFIYNIHKENKIYRSLKD